MERNIGDQLNKAFEAYRQASIEKDSAKRELQQKTDYYERYTQQLQQRIDDQQQKISKLEAQLMSAKQLPGEVRCEVLPRTQDEKNALPFNHLLDNANSCRKTHYLKEEMETAVEAPHILPVNSSAENKHVLEAFEALQGKFQQIRTLTRRQKDHLKRFYRGNDMTNEQQFSMPIQCTDGTTEQAERPFPTGARSGSGSGAEPQQTPAPLASRGADPENNRDLVESLARLSVKFPPGADSEYDFLNSAPERHLEQLAALRKRPAVGGGGPAAAAEEMSAELAIPFPYPSSASLPSSPSASLSQESVRGPQQPLWSPALCDEPSVPPARVEPSSSPPPSPPQSGGPDSCAFCNAVVPQDDMKSHLYSHCKTEPPRH